MSRTHDDLGRPIHRSVPTPTASTAKRKQERGHAREIAARARADEQARADAAAASIEAALKANREAAQR
jgi:hypothetical protein